MKFMNIKVLKIALVIIALFVVGCSSDDGRLVELKSGPFQNVWLLQDSEQDDVKFYLTYHAGEKYNDGPEGLAHYVEHLAWLNAGAVQSRFQHSNAWTNIHTATYWVESEIDQIKDAFDRLIRTSQPLSKLDNKFMLEERLIVLREYELRVGDNKLYSHYLAMGDLLYEGSELGRSVIGDEDSIRQFSIEAAQEFHGKYYDLSNATLLVAGNISQAATERLYNGYVHIEATNRPKSNLILKELYDKETIEVEGIQSDKLSYAKLVQMPASLEPHKLEETISIIEQMLDSTSEGGLAKPLRFDNFIAANFSFSLTSIEGGYILLEFNAEPDIGVDLAQLLSEFEKVLKTTLSHGISKSVFDGIKSEDLRFLHQNAAKFDQNLSAISYAISQSAVPQDFVAIRNVLKTVRLADVNLTFKALNSTGRTIVRLFKQKEN